MYLLYSALLACAAVLTAPWWLARMLFRGRRSGALPERLGRVPARLGTVTGCIWVHAVSVGEVLAVSRLVAGIRQRFPGRRVLISTTTDTGQKLARERFGDSNVFYYPLDFGFAIRPYLRRLKPDLIALAESEFWPNFLRLARQEGARIAVVNTRISDRSLPRYLRLERLWKRVLDGIDGFLAQSEEDARRLKAIGAPEDRVRVTGNLKFDIEAAEPASAGRMPRAVLQQAGPVVVCGSTADGEEGIVLAAFATVLRNHPRAMLVLAPRRPERFDAVAGLIERSGFRFRRRSQLAGNESLAGGVLLLDTIGELAAVYASATVAFVGGSLVPHGGHNILEPALHGIATMVGPHTENFRDIVAIFERAKAVRVVRREDFAAVLAELLADSAARQELGQRAAELVRQQRGATEATLNALAELLAPAEEPQHESVAP